MPLISSYNLRFTTAMILSAAGHLLIAGSVIFTLTTLSAKSRSSYFSFLGSILAEKDVMADPAHTPPAAVLKPFTTKIDLNYGQTDIVSETLTQIKPRPPAGKHGAQKIFLKSTFIPEKIAPPPEPTDEKFQLKEPLHIPLKLEPHDTN